MNKPARPIKQDICAIARAMDAVAITEVSTVPWAGGALPATISPEQVTEFNARVKHARCAFASCSRMFTEVPSAGPTAKEFVEVSLKLSTNMQMGGPEYSTEVAGSAVHCIHRIMFLHPLRKMFFEIQLVEDQSQAGAV